ncbi:hypothetical protein OAN00_07160 [Pseudomonadales bacterium]|nr:hypothetical protein [Pseudomonadales bacterium]
MSPNRTRESFDDEAWQFSRKTRVRRVVLTRFPVEDHVMKAV